MDNDLQKIQEAYEQIKPITEDTNMAIASGPYAMEPRPDESKPTVKQELSLGEHIKGLKNWFNDVERVYNSGNEKFALIMLKNIADAINKIKESPRDEMQIRKNARMISNPTMRMGG